jgi:hypothetical protein
LLASDEMQEGAGGGSVTNTGTAMAAGSIERESTMDAESLMMSMSVMNSPDASPEKMSVGLTAANTQKDLRSTSEGRLGGEGGIDEDENTFIMNQGLGLTNGEKYICYMCYETHNTIEDPLIAPCDCRGDTRFLHVQCLQRWYQSSSHGGGGAQAQVIRTTGNGAPACKICGAAYKTTFRRHDGRKASILEVSLL